MKKILILVSLLLVAAILFPSCTGNGGGKETSASGSSEETADPDLDPETRYLEIDGKYTVIRGDIASATEIDAATALLAYFKAGGTTLKITTDWSKNPVTEYEIIVGSTTRESSDFYIADRELLGAGGYIIKAVGSKILITGGGDEGTEAAAAKFMELFPLSDGKVSLPESFEYIFSPSAVLSGVTLAGSPIEEYAIVAAKDGLIMRAARYLQKELFSLAGVILRISPQESGKAIRLETAGNEGFTVSVGEADMTITSSEKVGLMRGIDDFLSSLDKTGTGPLDLKAGYSFAKDYGNFASYEDFGAVGDGVTDDFDAIIKTHDYANANGLPVLAKEGATYYIGGADKTAVIKTDTDWRGASFIIDDRNVVNRGREVFGVSPTEAQYNITGVTKLKAGQENIGITLPGDCLVVVEDSNVKRYIRYGSNANSGSSQNDVIRVSRDGSVDPTTPLVWDYDKITSITARPIDERTLTLAGGTVTTIAVADQNAGYYYRGIRVYRSNVIIDGLTHLVADEPSYGSPYYGILILNGCADVEIRNCVFTAHRTFTRADSSTMGTYDLTVTLATNVSIINCSQTNDILDGKIWGVFASNESKNLSLDGCRFSRFDAHRGVANVTIKNSVLGHQGINLIGSGTALIENTTVYAKTFVNLRSDYGSTWNGELIIRNCKFIPNAGASYDAVIIGGSNPATHDFGYTCYLPEEIVIDGLYINDKKHPAKYDGPKLFANITASLTSDKFSAPYPMVLPKSATVSGLKTESGLPLVASLNTYMFKDLIIEYK